MGGGKSALLVDAAEALLIGLVNRAILDGEVLDAALATAAEITANSPMGVWMTKEVAWSQLEVGSLSSRPGRPGEPGTQIPTAFTQDHGGEMAAFLEKRPSRYANEEQARAGARGDLGAGRSRPCSARANAASMFASRWGSFEVPGIGSIAGEWASAHASATCWLVMPRSAAISSAAAAAGVPWSWIGFQGRNAIPASSHAASRLSEVRVPTL